MIHLCVACPPSPPAPPTKWDAAVPVNCLSVLAVSCTLHLSCYVPPTHLCTHGRCRKVAQTLCGITLPDDLRCMLKWHAWALTLVILLVMPVPYCPPCEEGVVKEVTTGHCFVAECLHHLLHALLLLPLPTPLLPPSFTLHLHLFRSFSRVASWFLSCLEVFWFKVSSQVSLEVLTCMEGIKHAWWYKMLQVHLGPIPHSTLPLRLVNMLCSLCINLGLG